MTVESTREDSPDRSEAASAERRGKDRKKKPGARRRRLVRIVVALFLVGLALRISLWIALPTILDSASRRYGLGVRVRGSQPDVADGGPRDVASHPDSAGGDAPILDAEYTRADVSVSALFAGDLVFRRLEVDGIDLVVDRASDGSFPGLRGLIEALGESASPEGKDVASVAAADRPPGDLDFRAPFSSTRSVFSTANSVSAMRAWILRSPRGATSIFASRTSAPPGGTRASG